MEFGASDPTDRDKSMKDSFESYDDGSEKKEKKKKKKSADLDKQPEKKEKAEKEQEKKLVEALEKEREIEPEEEQQVGGEIAEADYVEAVEEAQAAAEGSVEQFEAVAEAAMLEALQEHLRAGEPLDEALEQAEAETLEDLDIDEPEEDQTIANPVPAVGTRIAPPPISSSPPTVVGSNTPPMSRGPVPPVPPIGGISQPIGPNTLPTTPGTPNLQPASQETYDYQRHHAGDVLLGGIIGYLIGRRGGRIRTEERLLPIQKKLENEVKDLREKITIKEAEVRKAAAERFESRPLTETQHQKIEQIKTRQEKGQSSAQRSPERLGAVVLEKPRLPEQQSAELLPEAELLRVAGQISVENVSLRTMYEQGRIDQKGLRRAVQEHLSGGSVERVLPALLVGEERFRERGLEKTPQDQGGAASQTAGTSSSMPVRPTSAWSSQGQPTQSAYRPPAPTPSQTSDTKSLPKSSALVGVVLLVIAIAVLFMIFI